MIDLKTANGETFEENIYINDCDDYSTLLCMKFNELADTDGDWDFAVCLDLAWSEIVKHRLDKF